ncbi:ABC transporter substrate-binding protein [Aestuariirhabdus sp. Z084]|uniref:substrate-binding periplasmic protein n=1 Tax=Aestuariirhabdus haliotis TaxID=2918751 RepID=UPI00201B367F|nr:ABC transporter substrate-binding protein [Aestuariirhabdus haliotis]MCL6414401.1 ABC transporter substrate-binding protein [Aestuariirhabdus haliotis]MCL6418333.1 ABC transporter substrate-binding protein [Aestuariirhabdus haliotis]
MRQSYLLQGLWTGLLGILIGCQEVAATEIKLGVRTSIAPWAIQSNNTGIELDIVRESLAFKGYQLKPVYLPPARMKRQFYDKSIDGVMLAHDSLGTDGVYYSDSHITFQNVAITLSEHGFVLNGVEDLSGRNLAIAAFPNARILLGKKFMMAVDGADSYQEIANQFAQVRMLYRRRIELIVIERQIFTYYRNKAQQIGDALLPVKVHSIFNPNYYNVAFHNARVRDDFNEGLRALRDSGRYQEIFDQYLNP